MTDSAERWAEVEKAVELAKNSTRFLVTPEYPCLLELRARIQDLEDDSVQQAESTSFCLESLVKRIEALEGNPKRTSNQAQIGSSLLAQVCTALDDHHVVGALEESWNCQARAAILAVARWIDAEAHQRSLSAHNGVYAASEWLRGELEAEDQ
jgi:hypothetical protein